MWRVLEGLLPRLAQVIEVGDLSCGKGVVGGRHILWLWIFPVAGLHGKGKAVTAGAHNLQPVPPSGVYDRSLTQRGLSCGGSWLDVLSFRNGAR